MSLFPTAKVSIRFEGGSYSTDVSDYVIEFPAVDLHSALVTIVQVKKIIQTSIAGRDGSVIEYNGHDDYQIMIQGIVTGENGEYPLAKVLDMQKMLKAPIPIAVICEHLQNHGIYYLIITGSEMPQEPGGISYQSFTINAISYTPTELRILNV